jgi:hypothetical protein
MIIIESTMTSTRLRYEDLYQMWIDVGGGIGQNWTYDQASWDISLDDHSNYWLRIPLEVVHGRFDGEAASNNATIQIGQPYILHHELFSDSTPSTDASFSPFSAMVNQFQPPAVKDGSIPSEWLFVARKTCEKLEQSLNA